MSNERCPVCGNYKWVTNWGSTAPPTMCTCNSGVTRFYDGPRQVTSALDEAAIERIVERVVRRVLAETEQRQSADAEQLAAIIISQINKRTEALR
jgi:hypothetical protein